MMPRAFSLVMAYYDNPGMLEEHARQWARLPKRVLDLLHVRIIDDGSPRWPAKDIAKTIRAGNHGHAEGPASFELYRMKTDVAWNQDACRNIGVKHASSSTEWVLLTDMDHVVPRETWERLMFCELDPSVVYRFARVTAPDMTPYKYHPNTWAMRARTFWKCGGYDERLAGNYGTDGDFLVRIRSRGTRIVDLAEHVVRYPRELVPDASTTTLERKRPEEKDNIRRLVAARQKDPNWRPLHFSFAYERVL